MVEQAGALPGAAEASLADSREQFVSSLGRRLEALRLALTALERSPGSSVHRDHVRRRIHAFGAAAGVLGFDSVFEAFREAEGVLGRGDSGATIGTRELGLVARALDLVPSLVLGAEIPPGGVRPRLAEPDRRGGWPTSVLLFATAPLVDSLRSGGADAPPLECERTEDVERATQIVRMTAPDVAVIDADRPGARELVETLVHDPLLDPIRIVVVGTIERPEAAAALVALGALRVLPKPVSPDALRRAIVEAARGRMVAASRIEPIGTVTMEALAERLGQELRRGLVGSVRAQSRTQAVALGDGVDVLAAVWGSVARVRDLVTERSSGEVEFDGTGPEGAVPLAPWVTEDRPRATGGRERRGGDDVTLSGRRVLVVDDDPGVVQFLSGLLRATGAQVTEAFDGRAALALVRRDWPEVVVSDILMPGLDGFALCREIKRDLAVSDVPVILISWKEDLLQRVRELGAQAEGYLRKEASASTVVQRVREVLVPRARVEARIVAGGEAQGRLDGLTPRLVLELACRGDRNAQVTIRDAAFLYEVQVRKGRIRSVTRASIDGQSERGERVLAAMLGVRAGRFSMRPSDAVCAADWDEPLDLRLRGPVGRARAANRALGAVDRIGRVELEPAMLAPYLAATPASVRALVQKLSDGVPPRDILVSVPSVRLVETVLSDLVSHGAVSAIRGHDGEDLWASAQAEEETLEAEALATLARATTAAPEQPAAPAPAAELSGFFGDSFPPPSGPPESARDDAPRSSKAQAPPTSTPPEESPFEAALRALPPDVVQAVQSSPKATADPGVSGGGARPVKKLPLPRRSQLPEETPALELGAAVATLAGTPAAGPVAPVPAAPPEAPRGARPPPEEPRFEPSPPFTFDLRASATPAPVLELRRISTPPEAPEAAIPLVTPSVPPAEAAEVAIPLVTPSVPPSDVVPLARKDERAEVAVADRETVPPRGARGAGASLAPGAPDEVSRLRKAMAPLVVVGIAALSSFALVSALRSPSPAQVDAPKAIPQAVEPLPAASEIPSAAAPAEAPVEAPREAAPSPSVAASATPQEAPSPPGVEDQPLPEGIVVGGGRGLLEVVLDAPYSILVDGVLVGTGPDKRLPIRVGAHEVRVITGRNKSIVSTVEVREGRSTRLRVESVQ